MEAGTEIDGRYVLERLLGSGGMGDVWRGTDRQLERPVAVKVMQDPLDDPRRFQREARIAARLQHPGITVIHDVGTHEGLPFIVMELLHGRDLAFMLSQAPDRRLPVDTAVSLIVQAAEALQAAHAAHVVHRDLKPANLFLQDNGVLKICDFGIARIADATESLTGVGYVIGSAPYMSPEQCEGIEVDGRSDLYSLGCVLYELLTGQPPFATGGRRAIMDQHLTKQPSGPRTLRPDMPRGLDTIVLNMLAKDPDDRPSSASDVAAALMTITRASGGPQAAVDGADIETQVTLTSDEATAGTTVTLTVRDRTIQVRIPAGTKNGQRVLVRGQGAPGKHGGSPGDLYVQVQVKQRQQAASARTHVVDRNGRGDFTTVKAAISAAAAGDRILVRPGLYEEALVVTKPLEIVGDGPVSTIEIRARDTHVLLFQAPTGLVSDLTLRQTGGVDCHGVEVRQGQLKLDDCDISSESAACVAIRDGADPLLRRNKIHDGNRSGVLIRDGGLGTLEDNDISGNATSGVIIRDGANTTLRRNRIKGNKESGVYAYDHGRGTLEDNDIIGNSYKGVSIRTGGILIVRNNRINRNSHEAIWVRKGGRAVVEDNDLRGNLWGAWNIAVGSEANVTSARNKELTRSGRDHRGSGLGPGCGVVPRGEQAVTRARQPGWATVRRWLVMTAGPRCCGVALVPVLEGQAVGALGWVSPVAPLLPRARSVPGTGPPGAGGGPWPRGRALPGSGLGGNCRKGGRAPPGRSTPTWGQISLCFTLLRLVISAINFIAWYLTARSQASSPT